MKVALDAQCWHAQFCASVSIMRSITLTDVPEWTGG